MITCATVLHRWTITGVPKPLTHNNFSINYRKITKAGNSFDVRKVTQPLLFFTLLLYIQWTTTCGVLIDCRRGTLLPHTSAMCRKGMFHTQDCRKPCKSMASMTLLSMQWEHQCQQPWETAPTSGRGTMTCGRKTGMHSLQQGAWRLSDSTNMNWPRYAYVTSAMFAVSCCCVAALCDIHCWLQEQNTYHELVRDGTGTPLLKWITMDPYTGNPDPTSQPEGTAPTTTAKTKRRKVGQ